MYIAVDFDGTVVTHDFPKIGKDIGAIPVLKNIINNGHKLLLNTMRSGKELDQAVNWFKQNDIELFGVNNNPTQTTWTTSPKVYANLYIDDAALGISLIYDEKIHSRPFVNWKDIEEALFTIGIIQIKGI